MICTSSLNKLIYTNIFFLFQDAGETIIELPQNQSGKYFFFDTYNQFFKNDIQFNKIIFETLNCLFYLSEQEQL